MSLTEFNERVWSKVDGPKSNHPFRASILNPTQRSTSKIDLTIGPSMSGPVQTVC